MTDHMTMEEGTSRSLHEHEIVELALQVPGRVVGGRLYTWHTKTEIEVYVATYGGMSHTVSMLTDVFAVHMNGAPYLLNVSASGRSSFAISNGGTVAMVFERVEELP